MSSVSGYQPEFFSAHDPVVERSARALVPQVLARVPARCVVDVGCGIGTWLSVLAAHGVEDFVGIDGEYVVPQLHIPRERFIPADLADPSGIRGAVGAFDLAMCLEVAEHLPSSRSETLVADLVRLAPAVLFSAAIPGQGGDHHINEQWPGYWHSFFRRHGFSAWDGFRIPNWDNEDVAPWYRQNLVLYLSPGAAERLGLSGELLQGAPPAFVHPWFWERVHPQLPLRRSLPRRLLGRLRRIISR